VCWVRVYVTVRKRKIIEIIVVGISHSLPKISLLAQVLGFSLAGVCLTVRKFES